MLNPIVAKYMILTRVLLPEYEEEEIKKEEEVQGLLLCSGKEPAVCWKAFVLFHSALMEAWLHG